MIRPGSDVAVYLCREPVDMRKSMDGLSLLDGPGHDLSSLRGLSKDGADFVALRCVQ